MRIYTQMCVPLTVAVMHVCKTVTLRTGIFRMQNTISGLLMHTYVNSLTGKGRDQDTFCMYYFSETI